MEKIRILKKKRKIRMKEKKLAGAGWPLDAAGMRPVHESITGAATRRRRRRRWRRRRRG